MRACPLLLTLMLVSGFTCALQSIWTLHLTLQYWLITGGSLMPEMLRGCGASGFASATALTLQMTSDLAEPALANVNAHLGNLPHGMLAM